MSLVNLSRSFKKSVLVLLLICFYTNSASAVAYSSINGSGRPESKSSTPELVLSQAVLLDENQKPICSVSLAGRSDLAPRFASVAEEGFESSSPYLLPPCDENELAVIQMTSQAAAHNVKTAALPAVILAGVAICEMTGLVGVALGGASAAGVYAASGDVPGTIVGTLEGFVRLADKPRLIRYIAGGPVGFVCGSVGDFVGRNSVLFLLEQGKKTGLLSR